jgi:membrane-associated protein
MSLLSIIGDLLKIFSTELLIKNGGLLLVFLFVFGQTGLFFCFFLPSGALMFTAGVFTATGALPYNIFVICSFLTLAAVLGNGTGYWFGRKAGLLLYNRKNSKFFRPEHLVAATNFYQNWGRLASAVALFFPVIRTFAPIVAGMVKMRFSRFIFFASIGSVLWVAGFVLAGYFIGTIPVLKQYISYVVVAIIIVVTTPIVIGIIRKWKKMGSKKKN